ncbi:acyltransferase [Microbaculum marinum]|uniref:Acyltransferase n=1 Tax=Microbaculum marinum TaxID=1764581 RepID=A0AAW9RVA5_9HYPH
MSASDPSAIQSMSHVRGLDSLRFVAAAIVALSHGATFPARQYFDSGSGIERAIGAANELAFNGSAAVLVFFVVSGFCIHYPVTQGMDLRAGPFWVRRTIRVGVPLIVMIAIAELIGPTAAAALTVILWTLYCELIYYALYPVLRKIIDRVGLSLVLVVSTVISFSIILSDWETLFYWEYSIWLTWLVALPVWLLGCLVAERMATVRRPDPGATIWHWRAAVWMYSVASLAFFHHGGIQIGNPALLLPFGFLAAAWVEREIACFQYRQPFAILEWAGRWSFSLYLVHNVVIALLPLGDTHLVADWLVRVVAIVVASLAFYWVVERPSHEFARSASRRLAGRQALAAAMSNPPSTR